MRTVIAVAFILLLTTVAATRADAFVTFATSNGEPPRWVTSPVGWHLDPDGSDDMSFEQLHAALERAFQTWSAPACTNLRFEYMGTSQAPKPGYLWITVLESGFSHRTDGALAYAAPQWDSSSAMASGQIVFNGGDFSWSDTAVTGSGNLSDLQAVATHEIGHAIGLGHSRDREATMFFVGGGMVERSLEEDDVRGVCFLYPKESFADGRPCDSCTLDQHCAYGSCVPHPWEGGSFCGADCSHDSHCPLGYGCRDSGGGGQCVPSYDHCRQEGTNIPFREYCWGHDTCSSEICLTWGNTAYCSQRCNPSQADSCPAGGNCVQLQDGSGLCAVRSCDPVKDTGCNVGEVCLWYHEPPRSPGADTVAGRCVDSRGGAGPGEPCGPSAALGCQPHLSCLAYGDDVTPRCRRDCRMPVGDGCRMDERCVDAKDRHSSKRGLCVPRPPKPPVVSKDAGSLPGIDSGAAARDSFGSSFDRGGAPSYYADGRIAGGADGILVPGGGGGSSGCSPAPAPPSFWLLLALGLLPYARRRLN
jgi:MYXO-CTERM domain-containing protein